MGAVYLAEHPGIGRRVAVKVLHKNYTRDEHLLARFLNEARAANAIRHPNIIEILDSGMLADGDAVPGDGAAGGREPGHAAAPARARCRSPTAVDFALPDRVGAGRRAREGDRPPRSQARQPVHRPRSSTIPARERIKVLDFGIAKLQQRVGGRLGQDAHRDADGHAHLHVARAVPRHASGRSPQRHLFAGRDLLRDACRPAAVRVGRVRRAGATCTSTSRPRRRVRSGPRFRWRSTRWC